MTTLITKEEVEDLGDGILEGRRRGMEVREEFLLGGLVPVNEVRDDFNAQHGNLIKRKNYALA